MTDTDTTPTQTDEDAPQGDASPGLDDSVNEDTNPAEPDTEAEPKTSEAKLRKRAQAAETERDTLASQVEALQRQIVDGHLEAAGIPGKAFWSSAELGSLLDESGNVSVDAVKTTAEIVRQEFSIARLPAPNPAQGSSASGPPEPTTKDRWEGAFKRR